MRRGGGGLTDAAGPWGGVPQLAEATHSIAAFTQGMLAMERTFVGVIELEPRQILEDGIRKQLVQRIASIGHHELVFSSTETSFFGKVRPRANAAVAALPRSTCVWLIGLVQSSD